MDSADGDDQLAFIGVAFEYVDPALIGVDPAAGTVSDLVRDCVNALIASGVIAGETRLVITGDFVRSVRDRGEPGSAYHTAYDTKRNTGMVGGKTIPRADGTVDVLLHAAMFAIGGLSGAATDVDANQVESNEEAVDVDGDLAIRTLIHEAQHVVIAQHGEAGGDFSAAQWARQNFLTAADQVVEEYRAEVVASRLAGPSGWNSSDLVGSVMAWLLDLRRIAIDEYQVHLDAGKLAYDIVQGTHTVWKLLGYVVAEQKAVGEALPDDVVEEDDLWQVMVEPHWQEFASLLDQVPGGDERTARADLDLLTNMLADLVQRWLLDLGFEFTDTAHGSSFLITDWVLLTAPLE